MTISKKFKIIPEFPLVDNVGVPNNNGVLLYPKSTGFFYKKSDGIERAVGGSIPSTNIVYVSKNGDDINGDGSLSSPFATINKAEESITTHVYSNTVDFVQGQDWVIDSVNINNVKVGDLVGSPYLPPFCRVRDIDVQNNKIYFTKPATDTASFKIKYCRYSLIYVFPGKYNVNILTKEGINYYFEDGCEIILNSDQSGMFYYYEDVSYAAVYPANIYGKGNFFVNHYASFYYINHPSGGDTRIYNEMTIEFNHIYSYYLGIFVNYAASFSLIGKSIYTVLSYSIYDQRGVFTFININKIYSKTDAIAFAIYGSTNCTIISSEIVSETGGAVNSCNGRITLLCPRVVGFTYGLSVYHSEINCSGYVNTLYSYSSEVKISRCDQFVLNQGSILHLNRGVCYYFPPSEVNDYSYLFFKGVYDSGALVLKGVYSKSKIDIMDVGNIKVYDGVHDIKTSITSANIYTTYPHGNSLDIYGGEVNYNLKIKCIDNNPLSPDIIAGNWYGSINYYGGKIRLSADVDTNKYIFMRFFNLPSSPSDVIFDNLLVRNHGNPIFSGVFNDVIHVTSIGNCLSDVNTGEATSPRLEKFKVTVINITETAGIIIQNGSTSNQINSTVTTSLADRALDFVTQINNLNETYYAYQDNPGIDEYFYVESTDINYRAVVTWITTSQLTYQILMLYFKGINIDATIFNPM